MSYETDGDKFTEKDISDIFGSDHLKNERIEALYNKLRLLYPSLNTYIRMDKARLRSIFRVYSILDKLEYFEKEPSKEHLERAISKRINGKRKEGKPNIRGQKTLKIYIKNLQKLLEEKLDEKEKSIQINSPALPPSGYRRNPPQNYTQS